VSLALEVVVSTLQALRDSTEIDALFYVAQALFVAEIGLAVAASVAQHGTDLGPALRRWTHWTLATLLGLLVVSIVWGWVAGFVAIAGGETDMLAQQNSQFALLRDFGWISAGLAFGLLLYFGVALRATRAERPS
jgi:hypothetical protein